MSPTETPPKPIFTLRIGVTGHRPDKLDQEAGAALAVQIEAMLQRKRQQLARLRDENAGLYADATPCLRVISALAEGADRLVASAALRQNCDLMAVLPFARDLYLRDFVEQASRDDFSALLGCASTIIELDGQYDPPGARKAGYASVGMNIVRHSDLLVAIWDGRSARGRGGTAEIVDYAVRNDCPVIWFSSDDNSSSYYGDLMRVLLPDRSVVVNAEKELSLWVTRLLVLQYDEPVRKWRLMTRTSEVGAGTSFTRYLSETPPLWSMYRFFDWFQKLVTVGSHAGAAAPIPRVGGDTKVSVANSPRADASQADDFVAKTTQEWKDLFASLTCAQGFHDLKLECLAAHYGWLDQLSTYYAGLYRSAYLINYVLAAGAVLAAASWTRVGSFLELVILVAILTLTFWGMARRWHERWIEYRELAEELRTTRYLRIVASPPVTPQLPLHLSQPDGVAAQTGWLHRAIVRECGLPSMAFKSEYIERVRKYLIEYEVADQIRYHQANSERLQVFDHRLHLLSASAFILSFVVALVHLSLEVFALNYLAILLPTIGAALFGIRNQGEFNRVSEWSKRMKAALSLIRDDLKHSANSIPDRQSLEAKAQVIARTMLSETSDWQMVFRARPLELPA